MDLQDFIEEKKINRIIFSKNLSNLENIVNKKFKFNNDLSNIIYFGVYSKEDIDILNSLEGNKYILFKNTDVDILFSDKELKEEFDKIDNKYILCSSENICCRLKYYGYYDYINIKINLVDNEIFKSVENRGNSIFINNGFNNNKPHYYGKKIIDELVKRNPNYNYIYSNEMDISYDKMIEIYKKCFIGLRVSNGEGLFLMENEMYSMGIKTINNNSMNGLKWESVEDIETIIKNETTLLEKKDNVDISVVIKYSNKKTELIKTLNYFQKNYCNIYNFEVVIVSNNNIENEIKNFDFSINSIKSDKTNDCELFNEGFKNSKGKIIICQKEEIVHINNIFNYILENLKDNEFYNFNSFFENNKYFCFTVHKKNLELLGGFDKRYTNENYYYYEELELNVKYNLKLNIKEINEINYFDIIEEKNECNKDIIYKNEELYKKNKKIHERNDFIYPKLLFLYWDGSPLAYLNYLTVISFNNYNPEWKIIVFTPTHKTNEISWTTEEQKEKYIGKCYFDELYKINNVVIKKIDLDKIGFYNEASEVIKSDYFRYYILEEYGGLWSDFDIIYTNSIEEKMNFKEETVIFRCKDYLNNVIEHEFEISENLYENDIICKCGHKKEKHNDIKNIKNHFNVYYPIGLFLTKRNNEFFNYINNKLINFYDKTNYQSLGSHMFIKLFPYTKLRCNCEASWCGGNKYYYKDLDSLDIFKNLKVCNEEYYLPIHYNEIDKLYNKNLELNLNNNIGIHWFNGNKISKNYLNYLNNFDYNLNNKKLNTINNYILKYYNNNLNFICFFNGQNKKLKKMIDNLETIYKNININVIINKGEINNNYNNIFEYKSIDEAVNNISSDVIIFQDISIIHNENILDEIINNKVTDCIAINKNIKNKNLDMQFKNNIYKNKQNDIIIFNKEYYNNQKLFDNKNIKKILSDKIEYMFPEKIPKILHFYWDDSKFDYLTSLTIKSAVFNNPDWKIILWRPNIKFKNNIEWESQEVIPPHTLDYNDDDYLDYNYLKEHLNVQINNIDYFDLGLNENYNEVLKSDIFRWRILHEYGGVWADMDILFINNIEKTDFEKYNCEYDDIEFVVSQYQKEIEGLTDSIDFYYIGFLMGSKNNTFYKKMYELSKKNINKTSYQGVGGDLMKSYFGLYDNIKKVLNNNNYSNLQSDSVYHYWWGDLRNMFLNNQQKDIIDYSIKNNNIIGYHWFRGVHLSKIYTHFHNYKNKIQNYENFKGPLISWVDYYKNIFNNFKEKNNEKMISIVMGYINRKKQVEITIDTIFKSKHKNFEIIIVNDCDDDLNFLLEKYDRNKIIIIENKDKEYINPCISYNIGLKKAKGEICILQNPECCHIGDILTTVNCLLKENDYMAFCSYYLDNYNKNDKLYEILYNKKIYNHDNVLINSNNNDENFWNINKIKNLLNFTLDYKKDSVLPPEKNGWCSHQYLNNNYLHFCTAIYKNKIQEIDYFSSIYKDGICFDDDDLVRKIILNKINYHYYPIPLQPNTYPILAEYSCFVVHQHHERFEYTDPNIMKKWENNKQIFIEENKKYIEKYLTIIKNEKIKFNIIIKNGKINLYNNNTYDITFNNEINSVKCNIIFDKENIKYIFNGGNLILNNNMTELYNNFDYLIKIYYNKNILYFNDDILYKKNNYFEINTKINNQEFKLNNLDLNTNIKIEISILNLNFKDNTILETK